MSVVVMESGAFVLMAKYLHQKQQGGVWYYRRRLPDEIRKHYPDNNTGILFYSLKTKDEREAARKANRDALQQDALWKAIREGQVAHGPEVIAAAEELLRTHGLKPGDGCGEKGKDLGLEPFQDFLHREAVSMGAPRDSSETENEEDHGREYLPPVHRTAGDLLFSTALLHKS
ncbi:hypothetical protein OEZ49_18035 [Ruegeria sp. WL0004]|uniref:DUF6538 domain-containing protein n=1 Tax=Ruegeria marisflavi TaxID=2984152 RepID=A0ABT2WVK1_9RHOB|nr:DUF6538 domain-containing protein [Ruegeria sp. WL0004]MCU9839678.1 hypothetical protein [Ruegeria sp. WL0004]